MGRPPAVKWYYAFCGFMALFKGAIAAFGIWVALHAAELPHDVMTAAQFRIIGWPLGAYGVVFGALNLALPFLPRSREVWALHLSNILLGMLFCLPAPASLALAIAWFRPRVRDWFAG